MNMGLPVKTSSGRTRSAEAKRAERYDALLDGARIASRIIYSVADGVDIVPGLKTAADLVGQIVQMAQVSRPY